MPLGTQYNPRSFYNAKDQEVSDAKPYAAIVQAVVEIVQSANFLGPVESNNGFTIHGVPIEVGGGGGGEAHEIQDEGTPLTARAALNFVGTYVTVTDDAENDATKVTVTDPPVLSVNGETGHVVLDTDDVDEGVTNKYNQTHTGEVTGATELTIAVDVVDNTNLSDMVEARIKGRAAAAGTGDPQDLTGAQVRTIINVEDGANNYIHPNHSGDVTSVGDGAQTIANDAVSNAKMANMAESRVKGRAAGAGTGDPQDLTPLQLRPLTRRTGTTTSSATPTINTDDVDYYTITAQAADITSMTTNLSGTPTAGQRLWIAITGTATRAITWGASFESSTVTLPDATDGTNRLDIGLVWNDVTSKWRCVAVA